jgi:hypothetical protein
MFQGLARRLLFRGSADRADPVIRLAALAERQWLVVPGAVGRFSLTLAGWLRHAALVASGTRCGAFPFRAVRRLE